MEKEKTTQFLMRPKNDFCFKQLMADAQIRQAFLSAVTGIPYEEIEETTLLPTSLEKQYKEDKLGILDVRIQLKNSGQVDVEMQVAAYEYWAERTLFYLSKMFTEQIHEGEGYDVLEKCIHIGILDFEIFEDTDAFYSRFHLWEDSRHIKYSRSLLLLKETCIIACIGIAEAGKAPVSGDRTAKLDAIYQCRDRGGIQNGSRERPLY